MILTRIYSVIVYVCDDCSRAVETADGEMPYDRPAGGFSSERRPWQAVRGGQHLCPSCATRRQHESDAAVIAVIP